MKNTTFLLIIVLTLGCSRNIYILGNIINENKYIIEEGMYAGKTISKVDYFENGKMKWKGDFAIDLDSNISNLKIGKWVSYYDNGNVKEIGEYQIGSYLQCCFGGLCNQFYNFKIGDWQYYYSNGLLKAKGNYRIRVLHTETSCEGGDYLLYGLTTNKWKFYNENGKQVKPTDSFMMKFEIIESDSKTIITKFLSDKRKKEIIIKTK